MTRFRPICLIFTKFLLKTYFPPWESIRIYSLGERKRKEASRNSLIELCTFIDQLKKCVTLTLKVKISYKHNAKLHLEDNALRPN